MAPETYNPSTLELRREGCRDFQASLGYTVTPCFKLVREEGVSCNREMVQGNKASGEERGMGNKKNKDTPCTGAQEPQFMEAL